MHSLSMPRISETAEASGWLGAIMVTLEYVVDRTAVGDDVAGEMPRAAKRVLEQELVGAGRLAIHGIVGAHDRPGMAFRYGRAESRKIGVLHVMLADVDVGDVTRRLRPAVDREMFRRGDRAIVLRIVPCMPVT